mgnify:CR=1 FL=1
MTISQFPQSASIVKYYFLDGFHANGIEKKFLSKPIHEIYYSRPCISGEEQTSFGTCVVCTNGYYLIVPPKDKAVSCLPCPENASCFGRNKISAKKGSFRSALDSKETIYCLNKEACLGGSAFDLKGKCAEGYTGMLCNTCDSGNAWVKD